MVTNYVRPMKDLVTTSSFLQNTCFKERCLFVLDSLHGLLTHTNVIRLNTIYFGDTLLSQNCHFLGGEQTCMGQETVAWRTPLGMSNFSLVNLSTIVLSDDIANLNKKNKIYERGEERTNIKVRISNTDSCKFCP